MKNIIGSKIKTLFSEIPFAKNLAIQMFISGFTLGILKSSRVVQFKKIGLHFTNDAKYNQPKEECHLRNSIKWHFGRSGATASKGTVTIYLIGW